MRTIVVVSAGLSVPSSTRSVADSIANAAKAAVTARGESVDIVNIELRELVNDIGRVFSTGMSSPRLDEVKETISQADGLIAVTPVFQASYSGLFKAFFDTLNTDALNGMPVIIAATAGTARHSLVTEYAMRPLFTYMHSVVVPTSLFAATDDFGGTEGTAFESRVARAAGELAALVVADSNSVGGLGGVTAEGQGTQRRRKTGVNPEEDDIVPFSQMLQDYNGS